MSCHRHRFLLLALSCLLGIAGSARAALISSEVKKASPLTGDNIAAIDKVINDQVAKLSAKEPETVKLARQTLIDESDISGSSASPAYQTQYMKSLAKALAPLMANGLPSQRNSAVILGSVAQKSEKNNVADVLVPQIKTMLASNDALVSYWAVKAAKYALAATVVNTGKDGGLGKLIIDEVKKADATAGLLIEEAYSALTLEPLRDPQGRVSQAAATMGLVMDLLEWRTNLYKAGTTPPSPGAEKTATGFLTFNAWQVISASPTDRDRAMKDVGDLACVQLNALSLGYEAELADAAVNTGNSIGALALHLNNDPDLMAATTVFKSIGPQMDPGKMTNGCEAVKKGFQKHNIQISAP